MPVTRTLALLLALVLLSFGSPSLRGVSAAGVPVACGDTVSGAGFLTGDLDCSVPGQRPITIKQGRLDLQGFSLVGIVKCEGSCRVSNGIVGGPIEGFKSVDARNLQVAGEINAQKNVHISHSTISAWGRCVSAYYGKIVIEDSIITGCRQGAVEANQGSVKVIRSSITGNWELGVLGGKVLLKDSTVTGNALGAECGHSWLSRICDGGPDEGLECGPGVDCVEGSCMRGATCADVSSFRRPVIRGSSCETSVIASAAPNTWYVCSAD